MRLMKYAREQQWRHQEFFHLNDDFHESPDVVHEIDLSQIIITIILTIKNDKSEQQNALNNNFSALIKSFSFIGFFIGSEYPDYHVISASSMSLNSIFPWIDLIRFLLVSIKFKPFFLPSCRQIHQHPTSDIAQSHLLLQYMSLID